MMTLPRILVFSALLVCNAHAASTVLASAGNFAVLAGTTITNIGNTVIIGDIGVSPGSAITGFGPGIVVGTIHVTDTAANSGEADLTSAYNFLSGRPVNTNLTGTNLGGLTLASGVYKFDSSADLTGDLTLTGTGIFIFQIASSFNIANNANIFTSGGADAANLYFQVGSSATIGTSAAVQGNFVALQSVSVNTGTSLTGRALAINGAVTLQNNAISIQAAPEPGSLALCALGLSAAVWSSFRRKRFAPTFRNIGGWREGVLLLRQK